MKKEKQRQQPTRQTQGEGPNTVSGTLSDIISREPSPPSSPPSPSLDLPPSNHLYHSHNALLLHVTVLLAGSTQGPPTRKRFCPLSVLWSRGQAPLVCGWITPMHHQLVSSLIGCWTWREAAGQRWRARTPWGQRSEKRIHLIKCDEI